MGIWVVPFGWKNKVKGNKVSVGIGCSLLYGNIGKREQGGYRDGLFLLVGEIR